MLLASSTASCGVRKLMATRTGAEDLFLADARAGGDIGEQGGRVIAASGGQRRIGLEEGRAIGDAFVDELGDAVALAGVDEGADVDALIQRITQAKGGHAFAQAGQEGLGDAFLHEQA